MDNYNPNYVWYLGGIISAIAIFGFVLLNRHVPAPAPEIKEAAVAVEG